MSEGRLRRDNQTNVFRLEELESRWKDAKNRALRSGWFGQVVVRMNVQDGVVQDTYVELAQRVR